MKRLVLFAATLLLCSLAYAQIATAPISGRAFDQYGQPIAFPQIRVCAASSTGVPCTPTIPIYQDYLQTIPVANPYSGDAFGNFTIYAGTLPFPNLYTIQVSANQGLTWSYVENGPGGSGGWSLSWGSITGTLSNQTDLESALNSKATISGLTTNKIPKATSSTTIGDSGLSDDGTTISTTENISVSGTVAAGTVNATTLTATNFIPSQTPVIDLRAYGGDPTMTTDSSAAVYNAAVAACAAYSALNVTVPIYVSPGKYLINNVNLTGLSCVPMFYGLDDNSTWFYYNGNTSAGYNANGVPESLIQFGSAGFGGFEGIGFNGVNQTTGAMATHLLWLTQGVDNGFRIAHSRFSQAVLDGVHEAPLIYSGNASFTASSTTVSVPSCSSAGLSNGQTVWLLGAGSAGVAGQDLSTTISSTATARVRTRLWWRRLRMRLSLAMR